MPTSFYLTNRSTTQAAAEDHFMRLFTSKWDGAFVEDTMDERPFPPRPDTGLFTGVNVDEIQRRKMPDPRSKLSYETWRQERHE